ncbi:hypothetical protein CYMTET_54734 [Cymbomonas tetramitiformis]|uniref:Uncharacterized protein n=1 Tax=Cymbomonas tetramitiformis TaxID=36881 RepID=A0AAE0EQF0_9CHLO|nr:hypothetical protein CYMTET_54734 [Cymbomonas tetramitiformis]
MRGIRKNVLGWRRFERSMTVAMESLLAITAEASLRAHPTATGMQDADAAPIDRLTVSVASVDGERGVWDLRLSAEWEGGVGRLG